MVTRVAGRWFIVLQTTGHRTVRIAVDQIAVLNDEGPTCGIVTATGFIAAIPLTADAVWAMLETVGDLVPQQLNERGS